MPSPDAKKHGFSHGLSDGGQPSSDASRRRTNSSKSIADAGDRSNAADGPGGSTDR